MKQAGSRVGQALWEEHFGDGRVPIKEDAKPKVEMLNLMFVVPYMMGALCWSSVLRLWYGKEVVASSPGRSRPRSGAASRSSRARPAHENLCRMLRHRGAGSTLCLTGSQ